MAKTLDDGIEVIEEIMNFVPMWAGSEKGEQIIVKVDSVADVEVCGKKSKRFNMILLRPAKITVYKPNDENFVKEFPVDSVICNNAHATLISALSQVMSGQSLRITALGEAEKHKSGQNAAIMYKVEIVKLK
jgi:hypothetical protein